MWDDIEHDLWESVLLLGTLLAPFSVWLFSRVIFNARKLTRKWKASYLGISMVTYFCIYLPQGSTLAKIAHFSTCALYFFFAIMAVTEIYISKEQRDKRFFSKAIMVFTMSLVLAFSIVSALMAGTDMWLVFVVIERVLVLSVCTYFLISNFILNEEIIPKAKILPTHDTILVDQILDKMVSDKLYLKEKLTIGDLAEQLNAPEYKVRQVINGDLGHKNFLDFVNSYRIKEASRLLVEHSSAELSVLEIAYKTGFNSIAPFNRAFKIIQGMTPTQYRKANATKEQEFALT